MSEEAKKEGGGFSRRPKMVFRSIRQLVADAWGEDLARAYGALPEKEQEKFNTAWKAHIRAGKKIARHERKIRTIERDKVRALEIVEVYRKRLEEVIAITTGKKEA